MPSRLKRSLKTRLDQNPRHGLNTDPITKTSRGADRSSRCNTGPQRGECWLGELGHTWPSPTPHSPNHPIWPPTAPRPPRNVRLIGGIRSHLVSSKFIVIGPMFGHVSVWPMYALVSPATLPTQRCHPRFLNESLTERRDKYQRLQLGGFSPQSNKTFMVGFLAVVFGVFWPRVHVETLLRTRFTHC